MRADQGKAMLPPCAENRQAVQPPLILGLDVGSVSVKGVIVDSTGRIVKQDYRLSRSRPLETADEVIRCLTEGALVPDVVAVTGSGRQLIGRLLSRGPHCQRDHRASAGGPELRPGHRHRRGDRWPGLEMDLPGEREHPGL